MTAYREAPPQEDEPTRLRRIAYEAEEKNVEKTLAEATRRIEEAARDGWVAFWIRDLGPRETMRRVASALKRKGFQVTDDHGDLWVSWEEVTPPAASLVPWYKRLFGRKP